MLNISSHIIRRQFKCSLFFSNCVLQCFRYFFYLSFFILQRFLCREIQIWPVYNTMDEPEPLDTFQSLKQSSFILAYLLINDNYLTERKYSGSGHPVLLISTQDVDTMQLSFLIEGGDIAKVSVTLAIISNLVLSMHIRYRLDIAFRLIS